MNNIININELANPYGEAGFECTVQEAGYLNNFGAWVKCEDSKFIVRDDNGHPFKAVGNDYQLVNHTQAFQTAERIIEQSNIDTTDMIKEFKTSHDGARAFGFYRFPQHREEVALNDTIELQLLVRNSIDGSMRFAIEYGALRLACLNGMTALGSIGKFKRKHTKYLNIHDAVEPLTNVIELYENSIETWKKFTTTKVTDTEAILAIADAVATREINKFIKDNISNKFNDDVEYLLWDKQLSRAYQVKDVWTEYKKYRSDLGSTLWAVYNAMTHWGTHTDAYKESSQKNIASIQNDRRTAIAKTTDNLLLSMVA
jgi:hypothetical protein